MRQEQIRNRRVNERIGGPNLSVFIKQSNGVTFEDGLRLANESNRVIASNARLNNSWFGREEWVSLRSVFTCWSGTITAYIEPNQKLDNRVEYIDSSRLQIRWVFPVPEQYRGMQNCILVAEHPHYNLEIDGKNRIINATNVDLIESFPASEDWYHPDPKHGIPTGASVMPYSDGAVYLSRVSRIVGPVIRGYEGNSPGLSGPGIFLFGSSGNHLGIAVEAPACVIPELRLTRSNSGRLIFDGTPAEIDAAMELIQKNLLTAKIV